MLRFVRILNTLFDKCDHVCCVEFRFWRCATRERPLTVRSKTSCSPRQGTRPQQSLRLRGSNSTAEGDLETVIDTKETHSSNCPAATRQNDSAGPRVLPAHPPSQDRNL